MPRSRDLGAPRPGNGDLYKKTISKMSLFERGDRILESRGPDMYICIYAYMCICVYAYMHICISAYMHTHICIYACVYAETQPHTYNSIMKEEIMYPKIRFWDQLSAPDDQK